MTTGLIPGGQTPEPQPTGELMPQQRSEPAGRAAPHVDDRPRSSVITARAAASFEPVGRSVATARSFVRDTPPGLGFADIVDDAVVLTSELVTNAVVHAGTHAEVLCLRTEDGVRIEVSDRYPEREVPLQQSAVSMGSPDREGGRGLQLCAALATRWGVDYTPTHKNVWFQLNLPERPVGTRTAGPAPAGRPPAAGRRPGPRRRPPGRPQGQHQRLERGRGGTVRLPGRRRHRQAPHRAGRLAAHPRHRHGHRRGPPALPLGGAPTASAAPTAAWPRCTPPTSGSATPAASPPPSASWSATTNAPCCRRRPASRPATRRRPPTGRAPTPSRCSSAPPPRTTSTACSSARWSAPATCSTATPPSCCSPRTTRRNWRSAPQPACPPPASASRACPSKRAPAATAPPACPPCTTTSPPSREPYRCSPAPACARSSPSR